MNKDQLRLWLHPLTLIVFFSSFAFHPSNAQSSVKGKVNYSAIATKNKLKRGANYRNRGKQKRESETDGKSISKVTHSIISLTPLDAEVVLTQYEAVLRQREKTFEPHVLAITKGSSVTFTNEDNFYHNVFSLSKGARFNLGRKKPGKSVQKTFKKAGLIKVFCDIHPQMNAYILCLETPFFSSVDEDGNYEIKNLPDGKYKLQFFNPDLEIEDQILELSGGQIIEQNFNITPDNSSAFIDYDERWYAGACCNGTFCSHDTDQ